MNYKVYVIQDLTTGRFYIGYTANLTKRLNEHPKGKTRSLKNKGPFKLIHFEDYQSRQEAYKREKEIKKFKSGFKFKELIKRAEVAPRSLKMSEARPMKLGGSGRPARRLPRWFSGRTLSW